MEGRTSKLADCPSWKQKTASKAITGLGDSNCSLVRNNNKAHVEKFDNCGVKSHYEINSTTDKVEVDQYWEVLNAKGTVLQLGHL